MAKPTKLPSGAIFLQFQFKGERRSGTFRTIAEARAWETDEKANIMAGLTGKIPNKTFGELLIRYRDEVSIKKKGRRWEEIRIGLILRDALAEVKLDRLDETHVAAWRDRRLREVSEGSVRREWNLLSNACSIAIKEWKWLRSNPFSMVRRPEAPPPRERLFTCQEIEALLVALGWEDGLPPQTISARVAHAFLFALEDGMRAGEICNLEWEDVRPTVAEVRKGKTRAAQRRVPLTRFARELLATLRPPGDEEPKGSVFNLVPTQIDALFRKAKAMAGVSGVTFHDSRANATTRLARLMDILDLARAIGHKDLRMLQVYYRKSAEDIADTL